MSNRCASTWCYVTISNVANKYCDFCKCPFQDCLNSISTCEIHRCKYQNCKDFIKDSFKEFVRNIFAFFNPASSNSFLHFFDKYAKSPESILIP